MFSKQPTEMSWPPPFKKNEQTKAEQVILSSAKTKSHLKQGPTKNRQAKMEDKENLAPWSGKDPWG